ncbi:MAG: AGE family epimerase/isomerase, partial [Saprospiraceae bacterium]|nr:AGE family epimerase/isomerase [Saprospiraceae bacterium]
MNKKTYADYAEKYRRALLDKVIPFWMQHSRAEEGGFYTCLLADGKVYDQDKFIWLQARQCWTFAMLYNQLEQRKEWLEM